MRYFIKSLADTPECTLKVGYRSAVCKEGYVELDKKKDIDIIQAYKAEEAPEPVVKKSDAGKAELKKGKATLKEDGK